MATLVGGNNHMRCCDQRWHRNISVNECKEGKSSFDCQVSWPRVPTRTTEIWVRCRLGNDMQWCTTHWYPAAPVRQKCQQPDHSQLRWFAQTASDADYWSRDISTDPTSAWNFSCDSGDVFFLYSLGLLDPGCTWSDRYSGHIASALLRPVAAWVLHGVGQLRVGKRMCRQGTRQMMQPRWFDVSLTCIVCIVVKSSLLLDIKMLMQEHEMIRTCGHFRTPIEVSLLSATSAEEI